MFGLNKSSKKAESGQIDPEITRIMGPLPDEAAPRMSSKTPTPVILNDSAQTTEETSDNLSKKSHRLKKFFTSWRH